MAEPTAAPPAAPRPPGPGRLRRWLIRPLGWTLALVALAIFGLFQLSRSDWLRERARVLLETRLSEALGRGVRAREVEFGFVPLTLEIAGLEIAGPRPGDLPVVEIDRVRASGDLVGWRSPTLTLHSVVVERPRFRLALLGGGDNLPHPQGAKAPRASARRDFALRIASLAVVDGVFELDEGQIPLTLTANAVAASLVTSQPGEMIGDVEVGGVTITLPRAKPYAAAVKGTVRLGADALEIRSATLHGPELDARVRGAVRWRGGTTVELTGQVDTSAELFRQIGYLGAGIDGQASYDGDFVWRPGAFTADGAVTSPSVALWGWRLEQLVGRLHAERERIALDVERAGLAGGSVAGSATFEIGSRGTPTALDLALARVPLDAFLAWIDVPLGAPLAAVASGRAAVSFPIAAPERVAGGAELTVTAPEGASGFPLAGPLRVEFAEEQVRISGLDLAGGGTHLLADGAWGLVSRQGEFHYRAETEQLGALGALLPIARNPETPELWLPTSGAGVLSGALLLAPGSAATELDLDLAPAVAPGLAAEQVRGRLRVDGAGVEIERLTASAPGASLGIAGWVPFVTSGPEEAISLRLDLDAAGWPLAAAMPWLPDPLPVDGPLTGHLTLRGPLDRLSGELRGTTRPATVAGLGVDALTTALRFTPEAVVFDRLVADLPAGAIGVRGRLALPDERLDFELFGERLDLSRPPFAALSAGGLSGTLRLAGPIGGTLAHPALTLTATMRDLVAGKRRLGDDGQAELVLDWRDDRLQAQGSLFGLAELHGGGGFRLDFADLDFDVAVQDVTGLVALAGLEAIEGLSGRLRGRLRVAGDLSRGRPAVDLALPEAELAWGGHRLRALEPLALEWSGEALELRSLYLGEPGTDDELFVAGKVGLGEGGKLDLRCQASLSATWIESLVQPVRLGGKVEGLALLRGTTAQPRLSGQAELRDGRVLLPDFPQALDAARATVLLYPDRLVLDSASASLGGGTVRAGGSLGFGGGKTAPDYRFNLAAEGVTVRWPAGWLFSGGSELTLVAQPEGRALRGTVDLDRVFFLQDVPANLPQLIARFLERQRLEAASTDELLAGTSLAVVVRAPRSVRVRNNVADLRGSADLSLRGNLAQPVVFGRIEAEQGGKITYSGTDYVVERARVTFANPLRIDPLLDLEARAKVDEYDVTLGLSGTVDRLTARFASDPPLSNLDILSLLSTGATASAAAASGAPVGTSAEGLPGSSSVGAEGFLYSQAAALLSSRAEGLFRLDKLRIEPLTAGRDVVSSARVTVGKRLSRKLYVTYSVDPSSTEQQQVQVEWTAGRDLLVVLTQNGTTDSYAVDLRWERRF